MVTYHDNYNDFRAIVSFMTRKTLNRLPGALADNIDKTTLDATVDIALAAAVTDKDAPIPYTEENLESVVKVVIVGMYRSTKR